MPAAAPQTPTTKQQTRPPASPHRSCSGLESSALEHLEMSHQQQRYGWQNQGICVMSAEWVQDVGFSVGHYSSTAGSLVGWDVPGNISSRGECSRGTCKDLVCRLHHKTGQHWCFELGGAWEAAAVASTTASTDMDTTHGCEGSCVQGAVEPVQHDTEQRTTSTTTASGAGSCVTMPGSCVTMPGSSLHHCCDSFSCVLGMGVELHRVKQQWLVGRAGSSSSSSSRLLIALSSP